MLSGAERKTVRFSPQRGRVHGLLRQKTREAWTCSYMRHPEADCRVAAG